ncbi:hypothetical protein KCU91_g10910, partial [Aureobasidium melanogenum]
MGHNHSKPRQQHQTTLSSLQNDPADLPPTYTESFEDTPRLHQSDKVASTSKTTDMGHETKRDELLLAVRDRERELVQTINQVRAGKRYTESVIASLEQEVRTLKQSLRQKTKDMTLLEEELEETKKLVEDRNSRIKVLLEKCYSESVKDCQGCKDLEQQLRAINSENTEDRRDLTTEVYALGCLIDFDNRYIETLYQRLRTCRIASTLVPPHLDDEEQKIECLQKACESLPRPFLAQGSNNKLNLSGEQQEMTHLSTAAAIEHRRQLVGLHIQEVDTELQLARDELKSRNDDPSFADDNYHATIDQEFSGI